MKKNMRIILVLILVGMGQSSHSFAAGANSNGTSIDVNAFFPSDLSFAVEGPKIVARVNDKPISEVELNRGIDIYIQKKTYHGGSMGADRQEFREAVLNTLIENEILVQEAKIRRLSIEEKDIDKMFDEMEKRFKNRDDFESAVKASGKTLDEYRDWLRANELLKKIIRIEIEDKSGYSDSELEDYYNANKEKFLRPETFKIRHILFGITDNTTDEESNAIKEKAKGVLDRAKKGGDFADLAYNYSNDPYRVKGGDLGWIHKGETLTAELWDIVSKLKVGEISDLIETIYGYHIIKLEEKKPEKQLDFSEIKDSLKKKLEAKRYTATRESFISGLKAKAKIEIY
ncbi:MAG: peptidylprolyl isomerase [Nitrospirae bacterium]|nr:peptidylprolyl isomerase [Nitrospirota bacterium]